MTSKTSSQKKSKDYATQRIDLENPENTPEIVAAPEAAAQEDENFRTIRTAQPVAPVISPSKEALVTKPVNDKPVDSTPPPALAASTPVSARQNDRIQIAVIIAIGVILLACLCSCTIIAVAFLINPPW